MKPYVLLLACLAASTSAFATPCEEVKTQIAAKLDAKHVSDYTLDVVPADQAGDAKVIGTCEGGTKKIVYTKK
jgi:Protein of unknown function (DUF1161)